MKKHLFLDRIYIGSLSFKIGDVKTLDSETKIYNWS